MTTVESFEWQRQNWQTPLVTSSRPSTKRIAEGINSLKETFSVAFTNRPKAEIDDIVAFFDNKKGTTAFNYTIPDSNQGGGERTVKVVCEDYTQAYVYDDFYSCNATFRRVYEP